MYQRSYYGNSRNNGSSNNSRGYSGNRSRGGFRGGARRRSGVLTHDELIHAVNQAKTAKQNTVEEVYVPKNAFTDFLISDNLKKNIISKGYINPTPIQDQVIPFALEGRDVIGMAQTGTGKTAAFLIPVIEKTLKNQNEKVLIITPTRELAVQIESELRSFTTGMWIRSVLCIGGASMYHQRKKMFQPHNFVIGTPGRIRDLMRQKVLDLKKFSTVILDETDRMVDIGFINEIKFFIDELPSERQSLFFSATITPKVKEILNAFVKDPVTVSVGKRETSSNVSQEIMRVTRKNKVEVLHDLLVSEGFEKILIFGKTKFGVEKLSQELIYRGFKAGAIHGDKRQNQRQAILQEFKSSRINILLATDVASRGLDIDNVSHVINYELPESYADYVHRIGRTGRGDKKGIAITLIEID